MSVQIIFTYVIAGFVLTPPHFESAYPSGWDSVKWGGVVGGISAMFMGAPGGVMTVIVLSVLSLRNPIAHHCGPMSYHTERVFQHSLLLVLITLLFFLLGQK